MLAFTIIMIIFKLVVAAIFITIIFKSILAIVARLHNGAHEIPGRTGTKILRERFASGEIDEKEYNEKLKILND